MNRIVAVIFLLVSSTASQLVYATQAFPSVTECDLENIYHKEGAMWQKYIKADRKLINPTQESSTVILLGEDICPNEKAFIGTPVEYKILYGKLVEIRVSRISLQPILLKWLEKTYGEQKTKPRSLFIEKPNGHLTWSDADRVVSYSYKSAGKDRIEMAIIQWRKHRQLRNKFFREQERPR